MSNPIIALALAALAAAALASCKTVRTVTKVESKSASQSDPLSQRFVGSSIDRWESGERHPMDRQRIDTKNLFGGTRDNQQFSGDNGLRDKRFPGAKKFGGNKEYRSEGYQFVRDRQVAREEAAVAGKQFAAGEQAADEGRKSWFGRDKSAGEGSQKWFGRDKSVARTAAYGTDREVATNEVYDATAAQKAGRDPRLGVLNPSGTVPEPESLTLDELRKILGR